MDVRCAASSAAQASRCRNVARMWRMLLITRSSPRVRRPKPVFTRFPAVSPHAARRGLTLRSIPSQVASSARRCMIRKAVSFGRVTTATCRSKRRRACLCSNTCGKNFPKIAPGRKSMRRIVSAAARLGDRLDVAGYAVSAHSNTVFSRAKRRGCVVREKGRTTVIESGEGPFSSMVMVIPLASGPELVAPIAVSLQASRLLPYST